MSDAGHTMEEAQPYTPNTTHNSNLRPACIYGVKTMKVTLVSNKMRVLLERDYEIAIMFYFILSPLAYQ